MKEMDISIARASQSAKYSVSVVKGISIKLYPCPSVIGISVSDNRNETTGTGSIP
jgi:hypothetical protein